MGILLTFARIAYAVGGPAFVVSAIDVPVGVEPAILVLSSEGVPLLAALVADQRGVGQVPAPAHPLHLQPRQGWQLALGAVHR